MWFPSLAAVMLSSLLLSSPASAARTTSSSKVPKNAVLLSQISTLTFHAGKQTTARRASPIPQAQCIGPKDVCKLYTIDTIRCTNAGSDYDAENVQWTCTAQLPEEFKLGSTDVSCEGYASSEDPYVLKGSCGVEYRLLLTEKGEEKYGKKNYGNETDVGETASDLLKSLFLIVFVGVMLIIVFAACSRAGGNGGAGRPGFGGFGGGGGGNDDPPPPYDYQPPPSQKKSTRANNSSTRGSSGARQEQWRPGFWTGALGGAAAGYMAGNRNRQPETEQRGGLFGGGNTNTGRSSWFNNNNNAGEGSSRSSYSPPAASSSRYESTGFGSTSRR